MFRPWASEVRRANAFWAACRSWSGFLGSFSAGSAKRARFEGGVDAIELENKGFGEVRCCMVVVLPQLHSVSGRSGSSRIFTGWAREVEICVNHGVSRVCHGFSR
eukprot:12602105-Alexandrium_andersonii.AAC.1